MTLKVVKIENGYQLVIEHNKNEIFTSKNILNQNEEIEIEFSFIKHEKTNKVLVYWKNEIEETKDFTFPPLDQIMWTLFPKNPLNERILLHRFSLLYSSLPFIFQQENFKAEPCEILLVPTMYK